jgi:hypothetical protein
VTLIDSSAKPLVTNHGTNDTANSSTEHLYVQFAVADIQTLVKGPVHVQFTTKDADANATPAAYLPKNIDLVVQK